MELRPDSINGKDRARKRGIELQFGTVSLPLETSPALASYIQRLHRCRELARWLWDCEFDFFVTINSNDISTSHEQGRLAIKKFGAILDRYFLGKKWAGLDSNERTFFVGI